MLPGLGGLNPKKMQAIMKQMGIGQEEIDASKVTIEKTDGSKIIIEPASVQKITMQGQTSYQITGDISEELTGDPHKGGMKLSEEVGGWAFARDKIKSITSASVSNEQEKFSEDDIKTIMEKTNSSEDDARKALEKTGDLAEAILKLSN